MELVPQIIVNGLVSGVVYVLIALGITLAFSILRVINFAHGEFYMLGAYIAYYFSVELGLNYWAAFPLAVLAGGLLGAAVDQVLLRRVGRELLKTLILTLGLMLILQSAATFFFGTQEKAIPSPISGVLRSTYLTIPKEKLVIVLICIALITGLLVLVRWTKMGRAMRAVTQDRDAALIQGVNVEGVFAVAFAISCGLAAAAGALMATVLPIGPFMGSVPLLKGLTIIILGGMGSIPGAVVGGLILGETESFITFYANPLASQLVFFVLIILILFVRPRGLFGVE
jgi:branched-chain amino acid transport system permease protein